MNRVYPKLFLFLLIAIPLVVGAYLRLDDLKIWHSKRQFFYYGDRPLFASYDAFIFARYGKEFFNGKYKGGKRDPLRFVPDNYLTDNVTYPKLVPMISFGAGLLAKLFKTHIENVDEYYTPLLAVLFVIPFVLFFWKIDLPFAGFSGALFGLASYMYLARTSVLRFDTDSLNLCLPVAMAYFLLLALKAQGNRRYLYLLVAGLFAQLYYWWYAHPGIIVVFLVIYWWFAFLEKNIDRKAFLLSLLFFNPLVLGVGVFNFFGLVKGYLINYFKPAVEGFPNVQMSISELKHYDLPFVAKSTVGSIYLFVPGFALAVAMFVRRVRDVALLLPLFLIGLMTLKGGNRFAMYLAPFVGVGLGYVLDVGFGWFKASGRERFASYPFKIAALAVLMALFYLGNHNVFAFTATPRITPALAADFLKLREITPEDAWIWTWWDYGYAIQYLGERATFHDGGSQGTAKTYFVATTFSTSDPQIANRVIKAIANIGRRGIEQRLDDGIKPVKIMDEIFSGKLSAPLSHPVYWVFTQDLIGKFAWINYFGTWDFDAKRGLREAIIPINRCMMQKGGNLLVCAQGVFDLKNGYIMLRRGKALLKAFVVKGPKGVEVRKFHDTGYYLEGVATSAGLMLFLTAEQPYNSMFNQMYILRNYDKRHFELVYDHFPVMLMYKVK